MLLFYIDINFFIVYICYLYIYIFFFSGVYLYFSILMYVKRHEQFVIGCGVILNKIYYYLFWQSNY